MLFVGEMVHLQELVLYGVNPAPFFLLKANKLFLLFTPRNFVANITRDILQKSLSHTCKDGSLVNEVVG